MSAISTFLFLALATASRAQSGGISPSAFGAAFLMKMPAETLFDARGLYHRWQLYSVDGGTHVGIVHVHFPDGNGYSEGLHESWDYYFDVGDDLNPDLTQPPDISVANAYGTGQQSAVNVDPKAFLPPGMDESGKLTIHLEYYRGTITATSPSLARFLDGFIDMHPVLAKLDAAQTPLEDDCICRFVAAQ